MKNYQNANGAGDERLKADVLTSEIAKLIVYKPQKVVNLLNDAGFPVKGVPGSRAIANMVTDALHNSPKFAATLVDAMLQQNENEMFSGSGDSTGPPLPPDMAAEREAAKKPKLLDILKSSSDILAGLGGLFGGKDKAKSNAAKAGAEADKAKADADRAKTEANRDLLDKIRALKGLGKGNVGLIVGVTLGLAAFGTIAYFVFKK